MRISDWSSDVCSSDLRESLRFPCPCPGLYESFYSAPREPLRPERRAYEQSVLDLLRPERSAPRMRSYVSVMTNGRSHTMTTSAVVSASHLARSEEHTSELQSLMRIPYAVFCLKNK